MLVGGMDVVGIFVFASESAFKNSPAILWQVSAMMSIKTDVSKITLLSVFVCCLVFERFQNIGVQLQSLTLKGGWFLWGIILG